MIRLKHILRSHPARASLLRNSPRVCLLSHTSNVRHVKFIQPRIRPLLSKCILYGTAFYLWSSVVLVRFDDDSSDSDVTHEPTPIEKAPHRNLHASHERDEHLAEEAEDEEPFFIPLGWSRLQEGEPYASTDPEWQEFVRISADRKKLPKLRDELANFVLNAVSGQMVTVLGGPLSITGFWLVHQFPSRAPRGYVRSGLEVTVDGISLVSKPLDSDVGDRSQRLMKPVHAALAIKDASLVLLNRRLDRFKNPEGTSSDGLEFLQTEKSISMDSDGLGSVHQPPRVLDGAQENMRPGTENPKFPPPSVISSLRWLPLPDIGPGSDLHLASMAFKLRLNAQRARTPRTPGRGTFFISGPVGLKGPHGFCRFEVRGEYNPATASWRTVDITLREVNLKRQRAPGRA